jgi:hypothetical protein
MFEEYEVVVNLDDGVSKSPSKERVVGTTIQYLLGYDYIRTEGILTPPTHSQIILYVASSSTLSD